VRAWGQGEKKKGRREEREASPLEEKVLLTQGEGEKKKKKKRSQLRCFPRLLDMEEERKRAMSGLRKEERAMRSFSSSRKKKKVTASGRERKKKEKGASFSGLSLLSRVKERGERGISFALKGEEGKEKKGNWSLNSSL